METARGSNGDTLRATVEVHADIENLRCPCVDTGPLLIHLIRIFAMDVSA